MYNLVENPVGSSLFITQPAADQKSSTSVSPVFTCDEVPQLLFNSDNSYLAVFFEKNEILKLFKVTLSDDSMSLILISEKQNVTSFIWSYIPTKYATIEHNQIFITVFYSNRVLYRI